MASYKTVLIQAASEIGYTEQRGNMTKFAKEAGHANGYAWCASFVSAILIRCKVPAPKKVLSQSSRTMLAEAKKLGWGVLAKDIRPGDVVHNWRGLSLRSWQGHVAFVESVTPTTLVTIEGNTNKAGSATGGSVLRKTRNRSWWRLAAWRPPYTQT